MAGPMEGIKIVAVEALVFLPGATCMLGDWGADVIKIEPFTGDSWRGFSGMGLYPFEIGDTSVFDLDNRNKRSVALNLKHNEGQKILYKLVKEADVFCSNYAPDTLPKLGISYEIITEVNPQIIYVVVNGYGETGPDKDLPGFDWTAYWARSGIMLTAGEPGPPVKPRPGIGDHPSSMIVAGATAAALFCRERTGIAQKVSVSLLNCGLWTLGCDIAPALAYNRDIPRVKRSDTLNPLTIAYKAKDEKWIMLTMIQSDLFWPQLCQAIGREDLIHNPDFENSQARAEHGSALINILDEAFATKPREEWNRLLKEHGTIFGLVQTCSDVIADPQANEYFVSVEHPAGGTVKLIKSPGEFSKTPSRIRSYAPEIGQHTEEVLLEVGYTWDDLIKLKEQGVII